MFLVCFLKNFSFLFFNTFLKSDNFLRKKKVKFFNFFFLNRKQKKKKFKKMIGCENVLKQHGYRLGKYIGHGMTSECFEITSKKFANTTFACKIVELFPPEKRNYILEKCHEELDIISLLDHPNIIRCYDYFIEKDYLFIVTEFCQNGSLQQYLSTKFANNTSTFLSYAFQLINSLIYCKQMHVAHLDIKPQNIMLTQFNKLKLADFGCSKVFKPGELFDKKRGSKYYMAPEVGNKPYDPFAADVYSLGMTLISMKDPTLLKRFAQEPDFWQSVYDECAAFGDLGDIFQACIEFDPANRPPIEEIKQRLEDYSQHSGLVTLRQSGSSLHFQVGVKGPSKLPSLKPGSIVKPATSLRCLMGSSSSLPVLMKR